MLMYNFHLLVFVHSLISAVRDERVLALELLVDPLNTPVGDTTLCSVTTGRLTEVRSGNTKNPSFVRKSC